MDAFFKKLKNRKQEGQAVVEYVLLLGVVLIMFLTVFRHPKFQQFLGKEGAFFKQYKLLLEYSYRYGLEGNTDPAPNYTNAHPSYFDGGDTRFFSNKTKYPE